MDSYDYVVHLIFDSNNKVRIPTHHDDLYYQIQTLVYLYQSNPDWPDELRESIKEYVQHCTDLLEMN